MFDSGYFRLYIDNLRGVYSFSGANWAVLLFIFGWGFEWFN